MTADPAPDPSSTHGRAGARVAEQLRSAILAGELAPGERVRQEDLAEQFGASRVPVREALRMLGAEGLITLVANAGAWVSKLSASELTELYEIRERLEPLLLSYNVPLLADQTIDELADLADAMEHASDAATFVDLDRQFHLLSYSAADTLMLRETAIALWNRTQHYRRQFVSASRDHSDRRADHDHHLMVAAIRNRDAEEASRLLAIHIRRTRRELDSLPSVFD